jgi:hypothetical protein
MEAAGLSGTQQHNSTFLLATLNVEAYLPVINISFASGINNGRQEFNRK